MFVVAILQDPTRQVDRRRGRAVEELDELKVPIGTVGRDGSGFRGSPPSPRQPDAERRDTDEHQTADGAAHYILGRPVVGSTLNKRPAEVADRFSFDRLRTRPVG